MFWKPWMAKFLAKIRRPVVIIPPAPSWRQRALAAAEALYDRDIVDGTPEGNRVIGEEIIGGATGYPDSNYRNGKKAWCGFFVQYCLRQAGFNPKCSVVSVGRTLYPYGGYQAQAMQGTPTHAIRDGEDLPINVAHQQAGSVRSLNGDMTLARPGDIIIHQDSPGSWHGHVMLCYSVDLAARELRVIEGNHSKTMGPEGLQRDGVGKRTLSMDDGYLDSVVTPSDVDFDPAYEYRA